MGFNVREIHIAFYDTTGIDVSRIFNAGQIVSTRLWQDNKEDTMLYFYLVQRTEIVMNVVYSSV